MAKPRTARKEAPSPPARAGQREQAPADPVSTTECAWCGKPVPEDEAFMLRVGAILCQTCAAEAGRIAADQQRKAAEK
jgi:hypothetical protein